MWCFCLWFIIFRKWRAALPFSGTNTTFSHESANVTFLGMISFKIFSNIWFPIPFGESKKNPFLIVSRWEKWRLHPRTLIRWLTPFKTKHVSGLFCCSVLSIDDKQGVDMEINYYTEILWWDRSVAEILTLSSANMLQPFPILWTQNQSWNATYIIFVLFCPAI